MKPETARGIRRSVPRRRRARGRTEVRTEAARVEQRADSPDAPSMGALGLEPDEDSDWSAELADFDPAEFAEFLEADDAPVPVDPGSSLRPGIGSRCRVGSNWGGDAQRIKRVPRSIAASCGRETD